VRRVPATLPDLTIRQLEYLVAVADEPTWALAAQRVGVTPSALSQGLAELERRIGVPLFESQGRRRVLRRSAAPVLDHARRMLALTRDLVDWSNRVREARQGRVRVGMIDVAAVVHCTDAIAAFRRDHPEVELTMSVAPSATLLDDLGNGVLDLVVCIEPPEPRDGIEVEELLRESLAVMAPPGTRIGEPDGWGPWLTFPAGSHTRELILGALGRQGAPPAIAAESHQPEVLVQMVRLGLGWTVLPVAVPTGGPEPIVVGPAIVERALVLARRSGALLDPAVSELERRLRAVGERPVSPSSRRARRPRTPGTSASPGRTARGRG
jgi:DNA-binding transcriptional LysR family regulator